MAANCKPETILVREDAPLHARLAIESEPFLRGWRIVTGLDESGLVRKIGEAKWNLFYLTGEVRVVALGFAGPRTLRRLVKRALAKLEGQKFNSLKISTVVSRRFFGIPFVRVVAYSRHIQEGRGLVPAKDFVLRTPRYATAARKAAASG